MKSEKDETSYNPIVLLCLLRCFLFWMILIFNWEFGTGLFNIPLRRTVESIYPEGILGVIEA